MKRTPTKDALAYALFDLLREIPYGSVTLSRLAEHAGVNRSTIYRNFGALDEIVLYRIALVLDQCLERFVVSGDCSMTGYLLAIFQVLDSHKEVFAALAKNRLDFLLLDALQAMFEAAAGETELSAAQQYQLSFHVGGVFNHMRLWISCGMSDAPESLADCASTLFSDDFKPLRLQLMSRSENVSA